MPPSPEIILTLFRRDLGVYAARLRYRSGRPNDEDLLREGTIQLDPVELNRSWANAEKYGKALTDLVFKDESIRSAWKSYRDSARKLQSSVRVRLELEEYAVELHRVRWECLHDPESDGPLLVNHDVWFSRYLSSFEMRQIRPRSSAASRVLVVAVCPTDLADFRVGRQFRAEDAFDVPNELAAIKGWMQKLDYHADTLPNPTLGAIIDALKGGLGYDVFYLVAHGGLDTAGAMLLMVDANGKGLVTPAKDLVDGLKHRVRFPPRLVVLSSCQSAGGDAAAQGAAAEGPGGELDAALGPQLGRIGIPAVVAMLGNVRQSTANLFVRTFFEHLKKDGQIDKAAMAARQRVWSPDDKAPDFWAPVLYTRLTNGQLWPGPDAEKFDEWEGLIGRLQDGLCVPVLGSGVLEPLVGTTHGVAERLLGTNSWFTSTGPVDLPQAAQFFGATQDTQILRLKYLKALASAIKDQFENLTPIDDLGTNPLKQEASPVSKDALEVRRLLAAAADRESAESPPGSHEALALLNCPIYFSTNPDDLLARAIARGKWGDKPKVPKVQVCNWLFPEDDPPGAPADPTHPPTAEAPHVCHLFGHLSQPYSIVLSEDDYFKFLVGMSKKNASKQPSGVNDLLTQSGLLFLGFHLDDWDFRAFLNFFMDREAAKTRKGWGVKDVAVQLDPDDGRNTDPGRVRRYLEDLFKQSRISIYWGSTQEFLMELLLQWKSQP